MRNDMFTFFSTLFFLRKEEGSQSNWQWPTYSTGQLQLKAELNLGHPHRIQSQWMADYQTNPLTDMFTYRIPDHTSWASVCIVYIIISETVQWNTERHRIINLWMSVTELLFYWYPTFHLGLKTENECDRETTILISNTEELILVVHYSDNWRISIWG